MLLDFSGMHEGPSNVQAKGIENDLCIRVGQLERGSIINISTKVLYNDRIKLNASYTEIIMYLHAY